MRRRLLARRMNFEKIARPNARAPSLGSHCSFPPRLYYDADAVLRGRK